MSTAKFRRCHDVTKTWEGGWSDHPADPGGNTMYGVSWLLLFLWSWNGVILPVVNATAEASIVPIPWEHLLGFAGLWLAIYGGGHTIKSVLGASSSSWRS